MAKCIYCGRPAGLFHKVHKQCHERHERAVSLMPDFFSKFLQSNLSVDRFQQLLQSAAEASFVKQDEMQTLAATGISQMVKTVLEQRLPTKSETKRVLELAGALQPLLSDDARPDDLLAKIDILRDLHDGKIPDLVTVAGPMPIELRQAETVIWIFNFVTAFRRDEKADTQEPGVELALDNVAYYGLKAFDHVLVPRDKLHEESSGDIVVTNRTLYFVISEAKSTRLPIARITAIRGYADGIYIACEPGLERTRTFVLNDSWFAANLVLRLRQLVRR